MDPEGGPGGQAYPTLGNNVTAGSDKGLPFTIPKTSLFLNTSGTRRKESGERRKKKKKEKKKLKKAKNHDFKDNIITKTVGKRPHL